MGETFDLYAEDDAHGGTRHVWLRRGEGGSLVLEGQDLGGGVSEFWGTDFREYEWAWSLQPKRMHLLLELLGLSSDASLEDVGRRLQQLDRAELQRLFKDAGAEFWSRVGD